jgi:TRAP-type C4-dicarboxylate transport system substrate-binding protein
VVPTLAQTAVPVSMVTGLPALALPGESWEGHQKMWENWWEFYNTFPEVQHELKDFKMVWPFVLDPSHMVTKDKPVRAPSDFKGMTIGGGGNIREVVTANGGATVSVMPPETYMNLDKGVIDGAFLNWGMCNDYDLHEVLKYYNVYDFEQGVLWLMMNLETWNAMPSGDQEIFDDLWVEASKVSSDGYLEGNVAAKQKAADAGRTIIEPTLAEIAVWEQAADMALQKWMDDAKGAGIDDPLEILERYKQLRKTNLK